MIIAESLAVCVMDIRTALLFDGSFFYRRVMFFHRKYFESHGDLSAQQLVDIFNTLVRKHISTRSHINQFSYLYRVLYYDCEPLDLSIHYPIPYQEEISCRMINFAKQEESINRLAFLKLLKKQRKVALRLGNIKHQKRWNIKYTSLQKLLKNEVSIGDLAPDDFYFEAVQKGVDTKLGLDIASLAYEGHVDQIILIAGDSDFVPAAKLARRKGIDFVLDSLKNNIDSSLDEHIDGLTTYDLVSIISDVLGQEPDLKPTWWSDEKSLAKNKARHTKRVKSKKP